MATSCGYEFQLKHFAFADVSASDFYVSQWFNSKILFVLYRAFMFLYCLIWSINTTIILVEAYPIYVAYLSNWAEWTLVVHFLLALLVAIYGLFSQSRDSTSTEIGCCPGNRCNNGDVRWFHHLTWVVLTATAGVNFIVTIIYWAFLSGIRVASVPANVHQHIMNSVLMILDIFISRIPIRLFHFIYVSLYGLTYVLFTAILHGADVKSAFYTNLLDWESAPGISAGVCVGLIVVGSPIIHLVSFGFYHLRAFIARSCGCSSTSSENSGEDNPGFEMSHPKEDV
uniref:protein rolling stone-like n=1 Tax=Styela clava TaxID=7725 RepID=UPI001939B776|nr:protein rolling stone-like [Styela clava]